VYAKNIFPFASLHPNVGRRLREEILLLPSHTASSAYQDRSMHTNDHYLQVVPAAPPLHVPAAKATSSSDQHSCQKSEEITQNSTSNDSPSNENETTGTVLISEQIR
jgi:hypothetical protein